MQSLPAGDAAVLREDTSLFIRAKGPNPDNSNGASVLILQVGPKNLERHGIRINGEHHLRPRLESPTGHAS